MTNTVLRLRLAPGIQLAAGSDAADATGSGTAVALQSARHRVSASSPSMSAVFQRLGTTGLPLHADGPAVPLHADEPGGRPGEQEAPGGLARLRAVQRLTELGWLAYAVDGRDGELVAALPGPTTTTRPRLGRVHDRRIAQSRSARVALSRFARAAITAEGLALESPRADYRVLVRHPSVLPLLAALGAPATVEELAARGPLAEEEARAVLDLLAGVGMLCTLRADGSLDEDADVALRQWEPHDLDFHVRTRASLATGTTGATYRFRESVEPLPAVKPRGSGRTVPLAAAPVRDDVAFDDVLLRRRSVRDHHPDQPITLRQVGHLLHRAARITSVQKVGGDQVVTRPYPGGGALHELELYLVVDRCSGLAPGVYHYRAADHELEHVCDPTEATGVLLQDAGYSTGVGTPPQILLLISARFPRLSWKYESIAYALVLKHVGCLVQTLYLVATSMGLAPCAIGGGDSAQFARVLRDSPYAETSVGEFALGVPAPAAPTLARPPDGPPHQTR